MRRIAGIITALGLLGVVGVAVYNTWTQVQPIEASSVASSITTKVPSATVTVSNVQKESAQIQDLLQTFTQKYPGRVGISVIDLDNGASAGVDADDQMVSASVYKIFVAYGIYQKIDAGSLTEKTYVSATGKTVESCMTAMIEVSDNDCGKALGDIVGWTKLDDQLKLLGLKSTTLDNYDAYGNVSGDKVTSPADVALFLKQLYAGSLVSDSSTAAFIALLKADQLNDWLPSGLPAGTVIAHKTGALYDYVHDAGIVYGPTGTYIVVIMTKGWQNPETEAPTAFADISSQLWNYFNS
jgi:beta-lactamase class A